MSCPSGSSRWPYTTCTTWIVSVQCFCLTTASWVCSAAAVAHMRHDPHALCQSDYIHDIIKMLRRTFSASVSGRFRRLRTTCKQVLMLRHVCGSVNAPSTCQIHGDAAFNTMLHQLCTVLQRSHLSPAHEHLCTRRQVGQLEQELCGLLWADDGVSAHLQTILHGPIPVVQEYVRLILAHRHLYVQPV